MAVKLFNKIWFKILLWILIIVFTSVASITVYNYVTKKDTDEITYKNNLDRVKNKDYERSGMEISLKWKNNYLYYKLYITKPKYCKRFKDSDSDHYLNIIFEDYQYFTLKEVKILKSEFVQYISGKTYHVKGNIKMTKEIYKEIDGVDYVSNFLFRD